MLTLAEHHERVARLADHELIEALQRVLSQERGTHARLLVHMAEVDARSLCRERAYGSMFDYCVQALHMSEAEAYLRIRAARLGREFPRALLMLEAGELNLSSIKLLAPVLTQHDADLIRKLPQRSASVRAGAPAPLALELHAQTSTTPSSAPDREPSPERFELKAQTSVGTKPHLEPLGPARYKLQLTAGQQLHDKVQQARDLMRHELPDGDLAQIVDKALDLLIADRLKRRFGVGPEASRQSEARGVQAAA